MLLAIQKRVLAYFHRRKFFDKRGMGWPITIPEFTHRLHDAAARPKGCVLPPPEEHCDNVCQLVLSNTHDGFSEPEVQVHYDSGPDPPSIADVDPPHWED